VLDHYSEIDQLILKPYHFLFKSSSHPASLPSLGKSAPTDNIVMLIAQLYIEPVPIIEAYFDRIQFDFAGRDRLGIKKHTFHGMDPGRSLKKRRGDGGQGKRPSPAASPRHEH